MVVIKRSWLVKYSSIYRKLLFSFWLITIFTLTASAEVLRKTYDFPYDSTLSRLAYQRSVESQAQQAFLRDYLSDKLGSQRIQETKPRIDTALFPTDQFLTTFKLVDLRLVSPTIAQAIVEADVDFPAILVALVRQSVLSFGDRPPRVMFVPDTFYSVDAITQLRSMIYDSLKSTKLEVVDLPTSTLVQLPKANGLLSEESLHRFAREAKVDYLIYINSQATTNHHPYGGVICDTVLNYKILRVGQNKLAGSGSLQDRGSGSNGQIAYLASLTQISKRLVTKSIGDLYSSVIENSEIFQKKDLIPTPTTPAEQTSSNQNPGPPSSNTSPKPETTTKPNNPFSNIKKINPFHNNGNSSTGNGSSVTRAPQQTPPPPTIRAQADIVVVYKPAI
jgi:hypothetical protein